MIWLVLQILSVVIKSQNGSWLECPPSFSVGTTRKDGNQIGPCDGGRLDQNAPFLTSVKAGQRLKVSWPSVNQGGGIVRSALVPDKLADFHEAFDISVIKLACYGYDQRSGKFNNETGFCNHPCNGRPGCHFQASITDIERYDTSIGIPTNLEDGLYVLQWKALIGNDPVPYYSCSKLYISGGNPLLRSCAPPPIKELGCRVTRNGPKQLTLMKDSSFGEFCYLSSPGSGNSLCSNDVDSNINWLEPINISCDSRGSCALATSQSRCEKELIPITECLKTEVKSLKFFEKMFSSLEKFGSDSELVAEFSIDFSLDDYNGGASDYVPLRAEPRTMRETYRRLGGRRNRRQTAGRRRWDLDQEESGSLDEDRGFRIPFERLRHRHGRSRRSPISRHRQRQEIDRRRQGERREAHSCFCPRATPLRRLRLRDAEQETEYGSENPRRARARSRSRNLGLDNSFGATPITTITPSMRTLRRTITVTRTRTTSTHFSTTIYEMLTEALPTMTQTDGFEATFSSSTIYINSMNSGELSSIFSNQQEFPLLSTSNIDEPIAVSMSTVITSISVEISTHTVSITAFQTVLETLTTSTLSPSQEVTPHLPVINDDEIVDLDEV